MHSMKASADKKLLENCQAGQRIVLTGNYKQKSYRLSTPGIIHHVLPSTTILYFCWLDATVCFPDHV